MLNQQSFIMEAVNHGSLPGRKSIVLPPPPVAAQQNILAEAMLETTSAHQKRHPLKWAVSLGAHVAILTVLLLLPLYFSQGLDLHRFNMTMLTAPLPPAGAARQRQVERAPRQRHLAKRLSQAGKPGVEGDQFLGW